MIALAIKLATNSGDLNKIQQSLRFRKRIPFVADEYEAQLNRGCVLAIQRKTAKQKIYAS